MIYVILVIVGAICLVVYLVMLFSKSRATLHEEVQVMALSPDGSKMPSELDPATLRRNLTRYAGDQSALQSYVYSLRERFEISVGIKVFEQRIREAGVKKELLARVLDLLRTEGELRRLPQEEALKEAQITTQLLRERAAQEQLQDEMGDQRKIRKLESGLKLKELEKKHADLDREAAKPQQPPDPVAEYRAQAQLKTELKKIDIEEGQKIKKAQRESESAQESEMEADLQKARKDSYPEAWESEGKWIENLEAKREKITYVDLMIEAYEQKKQHILQKYGVK
jgi:hypothetical protein